MELFMEVQWRVVLCRSKFKVSVHVIIVLPDILRTSLRFGTNQATSWTNTVLPKRTKNERCQLLCINDNQLIRPENFDTSALIHNKCCCNIVVGVVTVRRRAHMYDATKRSDVYIIVGFRGRRKQHSRSDDC